jgi:hypothetical protein
LGQVVDDELCASYRVPHLREAIGAHTVEQAEGSRMTREERVEFAFEAVERVLSSRPHG